MRTAIVTALMEVGVLWANHSFDLEDRSLRNGAGRGVVAATAGHSGASWSPSQSPTVRIGAAGYEALGHQELDTLIYHGSQEAGGG
jgi:hypothetical protein